MKPGSTVIVIGKALGTLSSENAILTQRGWANGTPKEDLEQQNRLVTHLLMWQKMS